MEQESWEKVRKNKRETWPVLHVYHGVFLLICDAITVNPMAWPEGADLYRYASHSIFCECLVPDGFRTRLVEIMASILPIGFAFYLMKFKLLRTTLERQNFWTGSLRAPSHMSVLVHSNSRLPDSRTLPALYPPSIRLSSENCLPSPEKRCIACSTSWKKPWWHCGAIRSRWNYKGVRRSCHFILTRYWSSSYHTNPVYEPNAVHRRRGYCRCDNSTHLLSAFAKSFAIRLFYNAWILCIWAPT